MKAVVCETYGPPEVLRLVEIEKPSLQENKILVKVHATTITAGDAIIRSGRFPPLFWLPARMVFGLLRPKKQVLGMEFSGVVEAIGAKVTQFRIGDHVFGTAIGQELGSYAEYVCLPADGLVVQKPAETDHEQAAAVVVGGTTALYFLKRAGIRPGQNVLIYGASGSVGTWAVQLAKHFGARVTAVCSGANTELVQSLGADAVIDYTKEDFSRRGEKYDIIFDTVGKSHFSRGMHALVKGGAYPVARFGAKHLFGALWYSLTAGKKIVLGVSEENREDLQFLGDLLAAGKIRAVIDRRFPLEHIAEAHALVDSKHKRGNIVVTVD